METFPCLVCLSRVGLHILEELRIKRPSWLETHAWEAPVVTVIITVIILAADLGSVCYMLSPMSVLHTHTST